MIDPTSVLGSADLARATRAADARAGTTSSVEAAVKSIISPDEQISNSVVESDNGISQDTFLYDSEGNLQNPSSDRTGQQVSLKA